MPTEPANRSTAGAGAAIGGADGLGNGSASTEDSRGALVPAAFGSTRMPVSLHRAEDHLPLRHARGRLRCPAWGRSASEGQPRGPSRSATRPRARRIPRPARASPPACRASFVVSSSRARRDALRRSFLRTLRTRVQRHLVSSLNGLGTATEAVHALGPDRRRRMRYPDGSSIGTTRVFCAPVANYREISGCSQVSSAGSVTSLGVV